MMQPGRDGTVAGTCRSVGQDPVPVSEREGTQWPGVYVEISWWAGLFRRAEMFLGQSLPLQ